jgi:hypothetical protein
LTELALPAGVQLITFNSVVVEKLNGVIYIGELHVGFVASVVYLIRESQFTFNGMVEKLVLVGVHVGVLGVARYVRHVEAHLVLGFHAISVTAHGSIDTVTAHEAEGMMLNE